MKRALTLVISTLLLASSMNIGAFAAGNPDDRLRIVAAADSAQTYTITIANRMTEAGLVMPSRKTAKKGELVILCATEREFVRNGRKYQYEFCGWFSNAGLPIISTSRIMAIFFMPEKNVTIYPMFKVKEVVESFNWEAVEQEIVKLHDGQRLDVELTEECVIPDAVLFALAGKAVEVTFHTEDCSFTLNGQDIVMRDAADGMDGYALTCADYTLSEMRRSQLGANAIFAVAVDVSTKHTVMATLHRDVSADLCVGYLYKINDDSLSLVSAIAIENGEAIIPVSESGNYVVTLLPLEDTQPQISVGDTNSELDGANIAADAEAAVQMGD